jgi:hypothetical protein
MKSFRHTNKSLKIRKSKKSRKTRKTKRNIKSKRGGGACAGYTFDLNVPIARDMPEVIAYAPNCQAGGKRKKRRSRSKRRQSSRK